MGKKRDSSSGSIVIYLNVWQRNPKVKMRLLFEINIKNCKALLQKVVIGRAVTALKQQNQKGKGQRKE
jgi:hypothetical protein